MSVTADEVSAAIQAALESRRRIHHIEWVEANRHVTARVCSFPLTFGGVLDVSLESANDGPVQIDIVSATAQMFDWGASRRNIEGLVAHLSTLATRRSTPGASIAQGPTIYESVRIPSD